MQRRSNPTSPILSILLTLLMLGTSFMALSPVVAEETESANTVTAFDDLSTSKDFSFGVLGGTDGSASISLPSLAQVQTAKVVLQSQVASQSVPIEYRNEPKKERFDQVGADYDATEVDATKAYLRLHRYWGTFNDELNTWDYTDNASTDANFLLDDQTFDTRIAAGRDTGAAAHSPVSAWTPYAASQSQTFFYDGRSIRHVDIDVTGNCGQSWVYAQATIKVFDTTADPPTWITEFDSLNIGWAPSNYQALDKVYAAGRITAVSVKVQCSYTWYNPQVRFYYNLDVDHFKASTTYTSKVIDPATFISGWQPGYSTYNVTFAARSLIPSGTALSYDVSVNGGGTWEPAANNTSLIVTGVGSQLRWRAHFSATTTQTPIIFDDVWITIQRLLSPSEEYLSVTHQQVWPITEVTPMFNVSGATGSEVKVFLTRDGGDEWIEVTSGETYPMLFTGPEHLTMTGLQFKVELISSNQLATPVLNDMNLYTHIAMFPTDVVVDFGSDQTTSWTFEGIFFSDLGTLTIEGDTLVEELNGLLPHYGAGGTKIFLNITSASAGVVRVASFDIGYGLPPVLLNPVPDVTLQEDTSSDKAVDLEKFFTDDRDDGDLGFVLSFQEEPAKITATVVDGHFLSFTTPSKDWVGSRRFVVQAKDGDGLKTSSNTFTVQVQNVNDDPTIVPVPAQEAVVGQPWSLQLGVVDPDKDLHTWEMSVIPPNSHLVIDTNTGRLDLDADISDLGSYALTVSANDGNDGTATTSFSLEVRNQNNAPQLLPVPAQTVSEGDPFSFQVVATDQDLVNGLDETLTFGISFPSLPVGDATPPMTIGPDGTITWQTKVGDLAFATFEVAVTVVDSEGASATVRFLVTVLKENTGPTGVRIASPEATGTFKEGDLIKFEAEATDADKGDQLTFTWSIDGIRFGVSHSMSTTIPEGQHVVELSVNDGHGHIVTADPVSFTVGAATPPTVHHDEATEQTQLLLGMEPGILLLVVVVVLTLAIAVGSTIVSRVSGSHVKELKRLESEAKGKGGST